MAPPDIALADSALGEVTGAEIVALPVLPGDGALLLGPGAEALAEELGVDLFTVLDIHRATGKPGEVTEHVVLDAANLRNTSLVKLLLVGVGDAGPAALRRAGAALARRGKGHVTAATSVPAVADDDGLAAFIEGIVLGSFGFHRRSTPPPTLPLEQVVLTDLVDTGVRRNVVERAMAVAGAAWLARTLALVPSNEKNPAWLAERAVELGESAGLTCRVWDEAALAADGFGGILGVGQGSQTPPRLVRLDYNPAKIRRKTGRRVPHIVLVGKGITFDTGGYSLKPADAMANMKRDMTGAGVVLAVMGALAAVGCRVKVTGLLPCAENAVSGQALRPGDVITHYGGRTTEVTNTDAEGRLVLADGLAYAAKELRPSALVDIATLTGAMKVALGMRTGGYFANDEALAGQLRAAGEQSGEALWRMPLVSDYDERLTSKVADADNAAGSPGAITAALFLQHFAAGVPWAHLDVASVGDSPVDAFEWTSGATGFGARVLLAWLGSDDPLAGVGTSGALEKTPEKG